MKEYFTQQQIEKEFNKIYIEEDDLLLEGEFVEGEGKHYIITGIATIESERYHDFEIEFNLVEFPKTETLDNIMDIDWEWYDYLC
ncbi:hypothetical protein AAK894_03230 [Lachnospiraceae bacterium 46-61]